MFRYILSFFRNPNTEISIEDAETILTSNDATEEILYPGVPKYQGERNFLTTTGKISEKRGDKYVIDNVYDFVADLQTFEIGQSVSYQKLISEGNIVIYNVNPLIIDDWGEEVFQRESVVASRVMVCKVQERQKRLLLLSPGDIKVDLDKISTQFIPYVGDWLEVEVKYEVNEQSIDLSGKVIEIDRILPVRPHIESAKISSWNNTDGTGCINRKIFFNKDSLSCGYVPITGDQVVTEIIESDQGQCSWRALKVVPEVMHNKFRDHSDTVLESHPNVEISDCPLNFVQLGETKEFCMSIKNTSDEALKLLNVEKSQNALQVSFSDNTLNNQYILPRSSIDLILSCTTMTMGVSNELLIFYFEKFTVGKYVNVNVSPNTHLKNHDQKIYLAKNHNNWNNYGKTNKQFIRGQKPINSRFHANKLPDYPVPKKLLDLVIKYGTEKNQLNLIEELKLIKKSLFTNLNYLNYEDKCHTLLHLDEIANIICIRQYDQERASFIPNGEFLMLEIENLAERRPSIVLGDRIIISDPLGTSHQEYEGNVFKVGARHVYLKFSALFHDTYKGEDYSIRVIPGRSSYKRQHHAIHLVTRNLGRDWLFPTRITEKDPQVDFVYDSGRSSTMDLIKKARLIKEKGKTNIWYNQQLNNKQKDAVANILKGVARPLPYIIFGPPGTGKTVTIIEAILQVLRLMPECRILVAAPSNSAADLIALRLISFGVLRPGDLVRLVSINYAVGENIPVELIPYCATGSIAKEGTTNENVTTHNGMTLDCSRSVLGRHKVTVSTCSSAGILHTMGFARGHFSHIFVDEAGQAAEPEVMIPVSFLDKYRGQVVLAGDPMQLGPVILSSIAKECGLNESYLERLINQFPYVRDIQGFPETEGFDPRLVTKLLHNYRSLSSILKIFSDLFYHGDLISTISDNDSNESRLLNSLASILPKTKGGTVPSIVFHGVNGENYQTSDSPSWYNPHEAAQVFYYLNEFFRLGLKLEHVGVISPYSKQVKEIKHLLREAEFPQPKIGTVEDFQGQEFDVIMISTVRSSRDYVGADVEHSLGFVSSPRRLNVAISRPKALLVIIGNPSLLSLDFYWRSVINYCLDNGAYTGCDFSLLNKSPDT